MSSIAKAVGYCRVSTSEQASDGLSLLDQEHKIKEYCKQHNLELIQIFIERGVSGSTDNRPEFRQMLADAANSKFEILVCCDNDRFGRNVADRLRIREMLTQDFGVELHSLADGVFKNTPTGRFTDTIKSSVSEYYRDLQLEKSASALQYKLSQGQRNLGHLLYGLTWNEDKTAAIHDPEEYPLLKKIVELRIKKHWSYVQIADYLNKEGLLYRHGKPWDRFRVGYILSQNTERYSEGKGCITFASQKYHYTFPQLISSAECLQLKKILPDYIQGRPRKRYLLSRKLICGLCHGHLHHNIISNKYKGKLKTYKYYTCVNQMNAKNGSRCKLPSIPQKWLDDEVWSQLEHLFANQAHFEAILFQANTKLAKDNEQLSKIAADIAKNEEAAKDADSRISNLVDFVAEGDISGGVAKSKIKELLKAKKRLQKQRQELDFKQSMLVRETTTINKLEDTRLWWASYSEKIKDKDKRALIDALVEEVRVYPFKHKEQPNPEDSRTPAVVHVEIMGHIPILFGKSKEDSPQPATLYRDSSSACR